MPNPVARADEELVVAIANGSLEALGELFERFEPVVRRYLGRLGIPASDADDLVQLTFLDVTRAAKRFDPQRSARSWLLSIATIMVRRRRRSIVQSVARLAKWTRNMHSEPTPTPAELVEGDETLRRLAGAFERLSAKKREVFVLVTLEGLSGEEAARVLEIPLATVWTRLHHARLELRWAVEEERP